MVMVMVMNILKNKNNILLHLSILTIFLIFGQNVLSQSLLRSTFTSFESIGINDSITISVGQVADKSLMEELIVYEGYLPRQYSLLSTDKGYYFSGLKVYPNPTKRDLYIENLSLQSITSFSLRNLSGKAVLEGNILYRYTNLTLETLPSGIYFISFMNGSGIIATEKIIKL